MAGAGIKGLIKDVGEAVVQPVIDEASKALDESIQSVAGTKGYATNPQAQKDFEQQAQQRKVDEEQEKRNIQQFLQQLQVGEQRVRQQKMQEEQQKKSEQAQEDEGKRVKQFEIKKKTENVVVMQRQRKVEMKRGK